ncbi:hypothetical protein PF003_g21678 [Phytophthora fragariae]|nr:hypothetical protein PF003_g21678 [Phytophthora fragariae]
MFVCDSGNQLVRKIAGDTVSSFNAAPRPSGIAVDSSGYVYFMDELNNRVFKQPPEGSAWTFATGSSIDTPKGITIDSTDNICITDKNRVLKFTPTVEMSVVAGSGMSGFVNAVGESARFSTPWGLTIGSDGGLYVADADNNCIRRVNLTTYAGICQTSGTIDGLISNATFENPVDIAAAADSVFYVVD